MADINEIRQTGYKIELEDLLQEKKLLQQLLKLYTEQYTAIQEKYPEEGTLKIHKEHLKKELGFAQRRLSIVEWRAKKMQEIARGREKYTDFCEKFPMGRIPLGYDCESGNPIALPLRQMFALSVSVAQPEMREKVYGNLLEAYAREGMQVMVFKKKKKSLFSEDSELLKTYSKRTEMIVLEPTAADGSRLVKKLVREMEKRAGLKRQYCKEHGLDANDPATTLKAFDFIRGKTKPLMVWFEEFNELEEILTAEDKASLGALFAAGEKNEENSEYSNLQRGRGYNLYYTGVFDLLMTCEENKTGLLVDQFNPQHHILRFASEKETERFERWKEYEYGIPGKDQCDCLMTYNEQDYRFLMPAGSSERENPDDLNIFTLDL